MSDVLWLLAYANRGRCIVAAILAVVLAFSSGCGASRMERMTMAAGALHASANGAGEMIDRAAEVRAAAALERCEGSPVECESAALAEVESLRPAQAAQHLFAASVEGYVSAVITAAQSRDPNWADALRHLGDVMTVYDALRGVLREAGIDLPGLPAIIHSVMGDLQ